MMYPTRPSRIFCLIPGLITPQRMGFRKLSKKGIDVTEISPNGSHSGSRGDKTVEELTKEKGTLEYWEKEYLNTFPKKTSQEIGKEIMKINRTFKGSRRGRIWTNGIGTKSYK